MAQFPSLPLFTDAYLGDTTHLTTLEHGAYLLLLITMWRSKGCCLPNEDKRLARYCRLSPAQWKRIKPIILEFFDVEKDTLVQQRLRDELSFVKQLSEKQSKKAKARWLKPNNTDDATGEPRESHGNAPTPTPTPVKDKEGTKVPSKNKRGTRLSPEWVLPDEWHQWAVDQGMPANSVEGIADRFRDYWIGAPKGIKLDWAATWRNWIRNDYGGSSSSQDNSQAQQVRDHLDMRAQEIRDAKND